MSNVLFHAVHRAGVEGRLLRLQADTHMLNRRSEDAVCDASSQSRKIQLRVRKVQALLPVLLRIHVLKEALEVLHHTELNRDTGTNSDERKLSALVKSRKTALFEDITDARHDAGVVARRRRLDAHLDDIKRPV